MAETGTTPGSSMPWKRGRGGGDGAKEEEPGEDIEEV